MPLLPNTRRGGVVVLAASCYERRAIVLRGMGFQPVALGFDMPMTSAPHRGKRNDGLETRPARSGSNQRLHGLQR